jgi:hypothetical protein
MRHATAIMFAEILGFMWFLGLPENRNNPPGA